MFVLKGRDSFKAGVVASKKIGKAVKRNRAKRRLREIIRLSQPYLPRDCWIVLIARRGVLEANFERMRNLFLDKVSNGFNN